MRTLLLLTLVACSGSEKEPAATEPPVPEPTDTATDTEPTVPLTASLEPTLLGLTKRLTVSAVEPVTVHLELDDGEEILSFQWRAANEHSHLVLGLRFDRSYAGTATMTWPDGRMDQIELAASTPPPPNDWPRFEVLVNEPGKEPGQTLMTLTAPEGMAHTVVVDEFGEVRWHAEVGFGDVRINLESGNLIGLLGGGIYEMGFDGEDVLTIAPQASDFPGDKLPFAGSLHHELSVDGNEFASLISVVTEVDDLPRDYTDLSNPSSQADIVEDVVVAFDLDGNVESYFHLSETLPTSRIGYDSLSPLPGGFDWSHANAVIPHPSEPGFVINVRHLDTVVFTDPMGRAQWILADPVGWPQEFEARVLTPKIEKMRFPYHAHAPAFDAAGRLVLFDNHNVGATPYTDSPEAQPPSRVVAYAINEEEFTVEEAWTFEDPDLYSAALGDADPQPGGTVVGTWGFLTHIGTTANVDVGRGWKSARIIEFEPLTGTKVWELDVSGDLAQRYGGWKIYRSERVSLPRIMQLDGL